VLADRAVAFDLPAASALVDPGWLRVFSERLRVETGTAGVRVGYQ